MKDDLPPWGVAVFILHRSLQTEELQQGELKLS